MILTKVSMFNPHPQGSASNRKARIGLGWDLTNPANGGCEVAVLVGVPRLGFLFFTGVSLSASSSSFYLHLFTFQDFKIIAATSSPQSAGLNTLTSAIPNSELCDCAVRSSIPPSRWIKDSSSVTNFWALVPKSYFTGILTSHLRSKQFGRKRSPYAPTPPNPTKVAPNQR